MLNRHNVIGFDFGTKYIGVALGDMLIKQARPLLTIIRKNKTYDWQQISDIINEWQPKILVVGLPLTKDDGEQEMSRLARKFADQLRGRYNLLVFEIDERLTSRSAQDIILERKLKKTKTLIDKMAAQIILQAWFDTNE